MKKKILIINIIILLLFPINIFAYSNKLIIGGETIGIEVKSNGVYIVGFYKVNNKFISKNNFKIGDIITEIDNIKIDNINDLNNIIKEDKTYNFKIKRNNKELNINQKIELENNILKTGLLVKDEIKGIGTLSYIDPENKVFASLGHEILEQSTNDKFEIKEGKIYKAEVTNIKKSEVNNPGEKQADISTTDIGEINTNNEVGIFGKITEEINKDNLIDIADPIEIKKGEAIIKTSIDNEIKDYKINIISLDQSNNIKNILFEITDKELLDKTGGIIQGMSGSPIIQNNKIIGVVNFVIVDSPNKGYAVFITNMLEEQDKIFE